MKKVFTVLYVIFSISFLNAQPIIDGDWSGSIKIMGQSLEIKTHFLTVSGAFTGTIDIPQQGAIGLKLSNIKYKYPALIFDLEVPNSTANFDGEIFGDSVAGKFTQAGVTGIFFLRRSIPDTKDNNSETNSEHIPYKEEEVSFANGENIFSGTLTIPDFSGRHPAVVMITGSGPQNRDEELFGFKPFRIIADYLTRQGIAVLRYDDRSTGKSVGKSLSESTTEDFATDVIEAVKFLQNRNDINPKQIGVIGHSEGGIVGPLAASKFKDIAFVICLAGTGVNGAEIILEQTKLISRANGRNENEISEDTEFLKKMIELVLSNADKSWVSDTLKNIQLQEYEKMTEEQKSQISDKNMWAETMANSIVSQFDNVWMKFFLSYDPIPALEKVSCPVLLLFGGLDLQVPPAQNIEPMKKALEKGKNKDYTIKTFENANHLFQDAKTGSPNEYASLDKKFINGFLEYLGDWISKRVTVSR